MKKRKPPKEKTYPQKEDKNRGRNKEKKQEVKEAELPQ